jgi:hypothetical protein
MTAAALGSLYLCSSLLGSPADEEERVELGRARLRTRQGLEWLGARIAPDQPDSRWHYYYLYALERLGTFSGLSEIGGVDWYREGAAFLLENQLEDGGWAIERSGSPPARGRRGGDGRGRRGSGSSDAVFPDRGEPVTTAFALLFLARATQREGGVTMRPTPAILAGLGEQPQPQDLEAARKAILRIGRTAVPDLVRALRDDRPATRQIAVEILREMTGRKFGYDARKGVTDNAEAIDAWETWYLKEGAGEGS